MPKNVQSKALKIRLCYSKYFELQSVIFSASSNTCEMLFLVHRVSRTMVFRGTLDSVLALRQRYQKGHIKISLRQQTILA